MRLAAALVAAEPAPPNVVDTRPAESAAAFATPAFLALKRRLHARFLDRMRETGRGPGTEEGVVRAELVALVAAEAPPDLTPGFRDRLLKELGDGVLGLGPLQDLLDDPAVTEIMVNGA